MDLIKKIHDTVELNVDKIKVVEDSTKKRERKQMGKYKLFFDKRASNLVEPVTYE